MPASYHGAAPSVAAQLPAYGAQTQTQPPPHQPAQWAAAPPNTGAFSQPAVAAPPPAPTKKTGDTAVALYDFAGERSSDLTFRKGDIIVIVQKTQSQNDWWTGKCNGREGSVRR